MIVVELTTATVAEVGATLRFFDDDGKPVVWGFDEGEMCTGGRGQILAPWPNRLEKGTYEFAGCVGFAAPDRMRELVICRTGVSRRADWRRVRFDHAEAFASIFVPSIEMTLASTSPSRTHGPSIWSNSSASVAV